MIRRPPRSTLFPYTTPSDLVRDGKGAGRRTAHDSFQSRVCYSRCSVCLVDCRGDRKSTRLNSSHMSISYAVFCLKKKIKRYPLGAPETSHDPQPQISTVSIV